MSAVHISVLGLRETQALFDCCSYSAKQILASKKGMLILKVVCSPMFIAAVFTIAKNWK